MNKFNYWCLVAFAILGLVLSFSAEAQFGATKTNDDLSFYLNETNFFLNENQYRYGYGGLGVKIGDIDGVSGRSAGGFPVYLNTAENVMRPFVGVEIGNTAFNLTGRQDDNDYYTLMNGLGAGIKLSLGSLKAYAVAKKGWALTNLYDKRLLHPDTHRFSGYQLIAEIDNKLGVSYDSNKVYVDKIQSLTVMYNLGKGRSIGYRQDKFSYESAPTSFFLFKLNY